jgi:hypothetical protein
MKLWLSFVLLIIACPFGYAQSFISSNHVIELPQVKTYTIHESLSSLDEVLSFFTDQHQILSLPDYTVTEVAVRQSLTGVHYTFNVLKDNIEIYGVQIKIHTNNDGHVLFIQDNVPLIEDVYQMDVHGASNPIWVLNNNQWEIASLKPSDDEFGTKIIQLGEEELGTINTKLFFQAPDSQVKAQVFLVNPLNTAKQVYGSPYIDSNDLDVPQLNAERKWVNMNVHFENGTFSLKTDRYSFGQISNPVTAPTTTQSDTFSFLRSQYQFEDVNAFYHITNMSDYVDALGFESALPNKLVIDAHGYNNGDFSSFNYGVTPVELEFGEGGVDDAEDGEIVVHEFSHALSYFAGGDSYENGRDRAAMEEGNADYFSASYSKAYTDFAWKKMFNWDGHNPFFQGISIGTRLQYPQQMTGNSNADREMWSTPLMCIYDKIGRGPSDSLVLEHLYYQFKTATIPDMANILLTVDSLMFNQKYHHDIRDCFSKHNILANVNTPVAFNKLFTAYNTYGFSQGAETAEINAKSGQSFSYTVFDNIGQMVKLDKTVNRLNLDPQSYKSGIYFVELKIGGYTSYLKLIKY